MEEYSCSTLAPQPGGTGRSCCYEKETGDSMEDEILKEKDFLQEKAVFLDEKEVKKEYEKLMV